MTIAEQAGKLDVLDHTFNNLKHYINQEKDIIRDMDVDEKAHFTSKATDLANNVSDKLLDTDIPNPYASQIEDSISMLLNDVQHLANPNVSYVLKSDLDMLSDDIIGGEDVIENEN